MLLRNPVAHLANEGLRTHNRFYAEEVLLKNSNFRGRCPKKQYFLAKERISQKQSAKIFLLFGEFRKFASR